MLSSFALVITALSSLLSSVSAIPTAAGDSQLAERSLQTRATPAAPHWVLYSDDWVTGATPSVTSINGFNVFLLSFLLSSGAADQAQNWEELTADQRSSAKSAYSAAGIKLMVSAFGSTNIPTSQNPVSTADFVANWVKTYSMDGVDIDYEASFHYSAACCLLKPIKDFTGFDAGTGVSENWLISFTKELRAQLPEGQYIITHAPVAPWFSPNIWGGGGYLFVNQQVGSLIDWYNVQFYNQGTSEYTTCAGLLTSSSSQWPQSAVFQIIANGIPSSKLVIGKPAGPNDASNGYIAPSTLATCVQQAKGQGWTAGVSTWEYPDASSSWITTVRSLSWPVSGSPPPPPTSTSSSVGSTPTKSPSGQCAGVAAWTSTVAYVGGDEVTYNGDLWTAKWWTEADVPGGAAGVWTNDGSC